MRINRITLVNFGSYEGENTFDTTVEGERNIVLIGGKNGAGKTTLFTAMRVCLYGYMSMGYKNPNAFYTRAITKLLNNTAKLTKPTNASVQMEIALSNGHALDLYRLSRNWVLTESLSESFDVTKNGTMLSDDEVANFEKYILSLIPPELFNLYFFDGEKIADFFMTEGSNTRIKEAFLTLCGYDTFEIMRRNFRRISSKEGSKESALGRYIELHENMKTVQARLNELLAQEQSCKEELDACDAELRALDQDYAKKGGISQEDHDRLVGALREEEKKRETWNATLRKWANDVIPFLMIRDQVLMVKRQIANENNDLKYRNFCEIMDAIAAQTITEDQRNQLSAKAKQMFASSTTAILDLSFEQSAALLAQVNAILFFDQSKIAKCKRLIKGSIEKSASLRQEIETSSIATLREYMEHRNAVLERQSELLRLQIEIERKIAACADECKTAESLYAKQKSLLEEEIKKDSINDISAKAIVMLDHLQEALYRKQISHVEEFFRQEIKTLMRKTDFIDDISIDNDFTVRIFRNEAFPASRLVNALQTNTIEQLQALFGTKAIEKLGRLAGGSDVGSMLFYCASHIEESFNLPIEIDKTSLSNGEKQIFIMALYHSLVQLCKHEVPFIIDTPFARIDSEHRNNISRYFFSELKGQVFILSTNEEINESHIQLMRDKILATYMLENTDNKRTYVQKNSYFGGAV